MVIVVGSLSERRGQFYYTIDSNCFFIKPRVAGPLHDCSTVLVNRTAIRGREVRGSGERVYKRPSYKILVSQLVLRKLAVGNSSINQI